MKFLPRVLVAPPRLLARGTDRLLRNMLLLFSSLRRADRIDDNYLQLANEIDRLLRNKLLTRRILSHMRDEVHSKGRKFAVLYVPYNTKEVEGRFPDEDRWYPWLAETTADLGIMLIDPTDALRARLKDGDAVYDDHWTPAGHEVIATVLAKYLNDYFAGNGSQKLENRVPSPREKL